MRNPYTRLHTIASGAVRPTNNPGEMYMPALGKTFRVMELKDYVQALSLENGAIYAPRPRTGEERIITAIAAMSEEEGELRIKVNARSHSVLPLLYLSHAWPVPYCLNQPFALNDTDELCIEGPRALVVLCGLLKTPLGA